MNFELLGNAAHSWGLVVVILVMVALFVTERLPVDVTAMAVLVVLIMGDYVSPDEAFRGFSSPVVVVMVSTLFVAGALRVTGVSDSMARWIRHWAGSNERVAIGIVMLISGVLSAFMNNVSAAALLMPAVAMLSHESDIPPSRLFIPLAFAVSLGGMLTLIGTPPNILAADLMAHHGLSPLAFFQFFPYGIAALVAGTLFMMFFGYKLLPVRKTHGVTRRITDLRVLYRLQDRIFSVRVPEGSPLIDRSLSEVRFGSLISGVVVTIIRAGKKLLSPKPGEKLHERDVLLVRGNPETFAELQALQGLTIQSVPAGVIDKEIQGADILRFSLREVHTESRVILLRELLKSTGVVPLAIERAIREHPWESRPPSWFLDSSVHDGDVIIGCITGRFREDSPTVDMDMLEVDKPRSLLEQISFVVTVAKGPWVGAPLHRLAHETKLPILGRIGVDGVVEWLDVPVMLPSGETAPPRLSAEHVLREGEAFLVSGSLDEVRRKADIGTLVFEAEAASSEIESPDVGIVELILTPRSELIGKTIADLHFREKYDAQVLALWRDGKPLLSLSSALPLVYGDALLVQGPRAGFTLMAKDPDFLLLSEHRTTPQLSRRSVIALVALAMLILVPPITGIPVHEAAFLSACLVVFTGAITMEQAYREIDWRVVFLLALMIPLGHAVDRAADFEHMAYGFEQIATVIHPLGLAAIFMILGSVVSQAIDSSVSVIFLGPIALSIGSYPGGSPQGLLLAVTLGSSLAFMLPTSCRANLLVSGAGGYRARDFMRVGAPITAVVGLVLLGVLYVLNF